MSDDQADDRYGSLRNKLVDMGRASIVPRPLAQDETSQAFYERLRPFAEAIYLVISVDGVLEPRETEVLRGTLRALTSGELGGAAMDAMLTEFKAALALDGQDIRLDRIAAEVYGDRDDIELVIALSSAAALASGCAEPAEHDVIRQLASRLGLSKDQLRELCAR
jgi:tellurite resistance protein